MFNAVDPRAHLLSRLTGLDRLSAREQRELARSFDEIVVPAGTEIIEEGTISHHTYFVVEGRLSVIICGAEIAAVGPGEPVGERSALGARLTNATVIAAEPTRLLVLDNRILSVVMSRHETVESAMVELMSERDSSTVAA